MNQVYEKINEYIDAHQQEMIRDLKNLVDYEGHSREADKVQKAMDFYCGLLREAGVKDFKKYEIASNRAPLIVATVGQERGGLPVLLSGHFDTVHMSGSFDFPESIIDGNFLYGPGAKDCKGGCIIMLYIVKALAHIGWNERPIKLILVSDEEEGHRGSIADRYIIEESRGCGWAFNMEPGDMENRLVIGRKTCCTFTINVHSETEDGDPVAEAACKIIELAKLTDLSKGTTISPTVIRTDPQCAISNYCELLVDFTYVQKEEIPRIEAAIADITSHSYTRGTSSSCSAEYIQLPPYHESSAITQLYEFTNRIAEEIGLPPFGKVFRGACSDAGNIAQAGVPVLDGCGIMGDGGHTKGEFAALDSMFTRAKLFAYIITKLEE